MDYSVSTTVLFHTVNGELLQRAYLVLDVPVQQKEIDFEIETSVWKREFSFMKAGRDEKQWFFDIPAVKEDMECFCTVFFGDERIKKTKTLKKNYTINN